MKYLFLLGLFVLFFGCIGSDNPIIEDEINNTFSNTTGQQNQTIELTLEEQLAEEFSCDNVYYLTEYESISFYECLHLFNEEEVDYIYVLDYHPMGIAYVSYIIYTDDYYQLLNHQDVSDFFEPIESENEAINYVVLYKGLNWYGYQDQAFVEKQGDEYSIKVKHEDNTMCPCYLTIFESEFLVTESGEVTEISIESVYEYIEPDCQC